MPTYKAADYQEVFDYFGIEPIDRPAESCYPYAPVLRTLVAGVPAAVKRTRKPAAAAAIVRWVRALAASGIAVVTPIGAAVQNPALIGDQMWVAYPWVDGRAYDGAHADIAAAGELLGRMHARTDDVDAALPRFSWPAHDAASVEDEVEDLRRVLAARAPHIAVQILARTVPWHRTFMADTLPVIRDSSLPFVAGSTDFKASNLVYAAAGPVLIDPDNTEYLPRILDLAIAEIHHLRRGTPGLWSPPTSGMTGLIPAKVPSSLTSRPPIQPGSRSDCRDGEGHGPVQRVQAGREVLRATPARTPANTSSGWATVDSGVPKSETVSPIHQPV